MHPLIAEDLAHLMIDDLHREAAQRRLARSGRNPKSRRRRNAHKIVQRAPAHQV